SEMQNSASARSSSVCRLCRSSLTISPESHGRSNLAAGQVNRSDRPPPPEGPAMSRVRIHNFSISLDGFATGEGQAFDTPFGHAGHRLHEWLLATRDARREVLGQSGGTEGVDDAMAERHGPGIGAEIMGANK